MDMVVFNRCPHGIPVSGLALVPRLTAAKRNSAICSSSHPARAGCSLRSASMRIRAALSPGIVGGLAEGLPLFGREQRDVRGVADFVATSAEA